MKLEVKMECTPKCWTPVKCSHGHPMTPAGRSAPMSMYICCEEYMTAANPRHLWDQHDDERWRFDPMGRASHLAVCNRCREEENDD